MYPLAVALLAACLNLSFLPFDVTRAHAQAPDTTRMALTPAAAFPQDQFLNSPTAAVDGDVQVVPPSEVNIEVEMVDEGIDSDGRWFQKLRVTINSGGTLADASYVLYGAESYYQDLFEIARQANPNLKNPSNIQAGQQLDVVVDPTSTYVVRESSRNDVDDATVYKFFNGGEMAVYGGKQSGVIKTVDFPDDSRAKMFNFQAGGEMLRIAPGSRLAEYRYRQGDAFAQVVKRIYGSSSAKALQDFIVKSGYTPDRWPPSSLETKRIIFSTTTSWVDERVQPLSRVPKGRPMNERERALMDVRAGAGIFPLITEDLGTVYQVQVVDPNITAKDASRMIFGSEDKYLYLANQAGINPPTDANGRIPEGFNPPLLGRSFEVFVEYSEEMFPDGPPVRDEKAKRTITKLINGTYLEDYDRAQRDGRGVHKAVYYPTGYKKIFYKADEITYTLADFIYFVSHSGRVVDGPAAKQEQVEYIGRLIWDWAPAVPREPGDIVEDFRMYDTKTGKLIEIVVAPRPQSGVFTSLIYSLWLGNPLASALTIVLLATGLVVLATMITRKRA